MGSAQYFAGNPTKFAAEVAKAVVLLVCAASGGRGSATVAPSESHRVCMANTKAVVSDVQLIHQSVGADRHRRVDRCLDASMHFRFPTNQSKTETLCYVRVVKVDHATRTAEAVPGKTVEAALISTPSGLLHEIFGTPIICVRTRTASDSSLAPGEAMGRSTEKPKKSLTYGRLITPTTFPAPSAGNGDSSNDSSDTTRENRSQILVYLVISCVVALLLLGLCLFLVARAKQQRRREQQATTTNGLTMISPGFSPASVSHEVMRQPKSPPAGRVDDVSYE